MKTDNRPTAQSRHPKVSWGTALLVTAAFIGPGTVMTASKAGATLGYQLLWAVVFSVFATCVLQIMAARLGLASGGGINEAIHKSVGNKWIRGIALALILLAILYGNSAYQTGNILGAVAGLSILTGWSGESMTTLMILLIGGIAMLFVWTGGLGLFQKALMVLVAIMSILFIAAAFGARPDPGAIASGLIPKLDGSTSWLLVIGLIGTTVVPYNLFLHASAMAEHWKLETDSLSTEVNEEEKSNAMRRATWDTIFSVGIGGVITAAILIAAASVFGGTDSQISEVKDVASQLRPTVGAWAETVFAFGILAAGLTSAITAPIAAGYCVAGCFKWQASLSSYPTRVVATIVIAIGIGGGILFGKSPTQAIILAQVANGLVLPLIAVFLLFAMNQKSLMGQFTNGIVRNFFGGIVILVSTAIAARTFFLVWQTVKTLLESGVAN